MKLIYSLALTILLTQSVLATSQEPRDGTPGRRLGGGTRVYEEQLLNKQNNLLWENAGWSMIVIGAGLSLKLLYSYLTKK